ncbi:helix-turn-helix domain-containing protein [Cohnella lupini]|uniref:AraC family transcriptional regulator n=1 Tax=Cohnella lupini TaxID=1294267 RepID=A0A3D9HQE4_9BACL|nr:helix-turn-helix domain-containing protein [Cohnella lupini]RED51744.1 AraC family transcriptional regulator [Cohnella lupini]
MLMRQFHSPSRLGDYIDSILLQEDLNPLNYANRNPVKVLPSTMAVIGIQYGNRMKVIGGSKEELLGTSGISGLQTSFREYASTGAIGTIIVRFKPGGLAAFTQYPVHEFQDANIDLNQLFPPRLVSEMEYRLREASAAEERVAIVCAFLLSVFEQRTRDPMITEIARKIQLQRGQVSIERLAEEFFVGKRTLERKFKALIGSTPKKFANIVRFQQAIQLRKSGLDYLDIIEACDFSDHAHFAHDFKAFAGCSPDVFFRNELQPDLARHFNRIRAGTPDSHTMYQ